MKTIAGYALMGFGAYYLLIELGGVGAIFKLLKGAKEYMPKYSQQIAQVEQKLSPQLNQLQQLQQPSTPLPTPTLIPNQPSPQPEAQWEFKLKTPWSNLETKANAR